MFSVIGGLGSAISYHCSVLVVLNHFEKWLSLAVGITASSSSVGMFIVTQITKALLSNYEFKNALRGWAILFFLATPLACSYDSRSNATVGTIERNEEESEQNVEVIPPPSVLRNGLFIIYLVSVTLVFFAVYTLSFFLVRFYSRIYRKRVKKGPAIHFIVLLCHGTDTELVFLVEYLKKVCVCISAK